jgi:DNA-binding NarL/FixJ family response regulator
MNNNSKNSKGENMRVLIVDDSKVIQERLIAILSELKGVEVVGQSEDPTEALEAIQTLKPDAVILDIRMPGGSGIDVLERIKKKRPSPIVIILTNYPFPQYRKKCMDAGADYFFDKSTEFEMFAEVIKKMVDYSRNN